MPDVQTNTTLDVGLALRAIIDHELRTFPIRDGMVIGRDPNCDIVVPEGRFTHASVQVWPWGAKLVEFESQITLVPLLLKDTIFVVGRTVFDCVEQEGEGKNSSDRDAELTRQACPRCRTSLVDRDLSSHFCPHCGAPLPADCPAWPVVTDVAVPAPEQEVPWWMSCMPMWLQTRVARDPLFFARRTTVLAYINTLFNLGLKYDAGVDSNRQPAEAMRYYRKAAQLGNVPARARLKVKEESVLSPLPPGEG